MPALQRSCDACVSAKRRCSLATPRCARCTTRNTTCRYINEPATAISDRLRTDRGTVRNYRLLKVPRSPLLLSNPANKPSSILGVQTWIPEVVRSYSPVTLQKQIGILRTFVVQFAQHGAASFLHPCLYESRLPKPLQHVSQICGSYGLKQGTFASLKPGSIYPCVSQMLRLATGTDSFPELVEHVQAIAILQILCLLEGHEGSGEEAERNEKIFWNLAQLLYTEAPVHLPTMLSPWRAWLFAESVRRTILVCHIIMAVRGALRRGFAVHLLCVEALPFDMRGRLWDAETADAWEAATAASHEPSLVSLRQFTTLHQPERSASPFEDLLLLSFKSWGGFDH